MAVSNVFEKDPDATLDYWFDWSRWLPDEDTISAHSITAASSLTVESDSHTAGSVVVWLSSGSPGYRYSVTCQITTSASRIDERTIKIDVKER